MRDDARSDSSAAIAIALREIADLKRHINRPLEETAQYTTAQGRADSVWQMHGKQAPPALGGETVTAYRLRLLREMQPHSPEWKDKNLGTLAAADAAILDTAEKLIYADAAVAARTMTSLPGQLRMERQVDPDSGLRINRWYGDPNSWMDAFKTPYQVATRVGGEDRR